MGYGPRVKALASAKEIDVVLGRPNHVDYPLDKEAIWEVSDVSRPRQLQNGE
ncbi:hypothetical protein ACLOJK_020704 [Asimina triloba]